MKWYHYLICLILICAGVICSFRLIDLFNKQSKEYGSAITIETKNDYLEICKFDFGAIDFDTEDYINYSNISTYEPIVFNGENKDLLLLFNGQPSNNIAISNGKISGDFDLCFYDLDNVLVSKSVLNVVIEFYASQTKVTITTTNANDSMAYLSTYMELNGAILKVVERSI